MTSKEAGVEVTAEETAGKKPFDAVKAQYLNKIQKLYRRAERRYPESQMLNSKQSKCFSYCMRTVEQIEALNG